MRSPDFLAAMGGLLLSKGRGLLIRGTEGKEGSEGWREGMEKQGNGIPPKTSLIE